MGVTAKGLRYPEGTVIANTIHTKIKELAEDVDSNLTVRDTRLNGLDSTTNATNAVVAARGLPISRHGSYSQAITNIPNNDVAYTTHQVLNAMPVPAGSRVAVVSMHVSARCATNAQCHWQPCVNYGAGWIGLFNNIAYVAHHNNTQPALDMGFSVTADFDMRAYVGQNFSLAVNAYNDSGSGDWIHAGYLHWSVTFLT